MCVIYAIYAVGFKSLNPVDIKPLFVILYDIVALQRQKHFFYGIKL